MKKLVTESERKGYKYKLRVTLNGTNENPWHRMGLTANPFPQIGKRQWDRHEAIVRELDGDPIPDINYIREKLHGFSNEFVELCCSQFRKGERVTFEVYFND